MPPSRYTAPRTASRASASTRGFFRPPLFSSPLPRHRKEPRSKQWAALNKCALFTNRALSWVSSPSEARGNRLNSSLPTARPKTASPRNSKRSFETAFSPITERWVKAVWSNARSRNRYPKRLQSFSSLSSGTGMLVSLPWNFLPSALGNRPAAWLSVGEASLELGTQVRSARGRETSAVRTAIRKLRGLLVLALLGQRSGQLVHRIRSGVGRQF